MHSREQAWPLDAKPESQRVVPNAARGALAAQAMDRQQLEREEAAEAGRFATALDNYRR